MKKLKLVPIESVLVLIILVLIILAKSAHAESVCNISTNSTNFTITTNDALGCFITSAGTTNGIDFPNNSDSSTTNPANLIIAAGKSFTIPSGNSPSSPSSMVVGSLTLQEGASLSIGANYAQLLIGQPLYMSDIDGDGVPDDITNFFIATGAGRRRKGLAKGTSVDCAPTDPAKWQLLSGYIDADHDGFGTGALINNICSGATLPVGYATNNTDCNDNSYNVTNVCCTVATRYQDADGDGYGNPNVSIQACTTAGYVDNNTDCGDNPADGANAHPGQTTCYGEGFTHVNGGISYDYNCDGTASITGCTPLDRSCTCTIAYSKWCGYLGGVNGCHGGGLGPQYCTYATVSTACGATGCYVSSYPTHRCSCSFSVNKGTCSFSSCPGEDVTSAVQTCL
jgi:hypothetical protein